MKTQLKFKDSIIPGYFIDENGTIYDSENNIQEIKTYNNRPHFKGVCVHRLVVFSFIGYKKGFDVHHLNEDVFDNRLENLVYLTRAEHIRLHATSKKHTEETKRKMSETHKRNKHQKGEKNSQFGTCWIYNLELKENKKIKRYDLERWIDLGWIKGRSPTFQGRKHTVEAKQKISNALKGKKLTEETKEKMSEARKGKIWINNGFINKRVHLDNIPVGFVKGRLSWKQI